MPRHPTRSTERRRTRSQTLQAQSPRKRARRHSSTDTQPARRSPVRSSKFHTMHVLEAEYLGQPIGMKKHDVMAALLHDHGRAPTFNRMSGIQEWANAVALFINIGPGGGGYDNTFTDQGQYISWFAQRRHRPDSSVIQKILKASSEHVSDRVPVSAPLATASRRGPPVLESVSEEAVAPRRVAPAAPAPVAMRRPPKAASVLLFCRLQGGAYVYCGPLSLASWDANARPSMRFDFRLVCIDELRKMDAFQALLLHNR